MPRRDHPRAARIAIVARAGHGVMDGLHHHVVHNIGVPRRPLPRSCWLAPEAREPGVTPAVDRSFPRAFSACTSVCTRLRIGSLEATRFETVDVTEGRFCTPVLRLDHCPAQDRYFAARSASSLAAASFLPICLSAAIGASCEARGRT